MLREKNTQKNAQNLLKEHIKKFLKCRIDGLAACRGAGAKEAKRTAVVCHQNQENTKYQEIPGKIPKTAG